MELKLDRYERRVLGVLMEKALTVPESYPMTLKAVTAACNQKQNRLPIMELDEDTVHAALERLRERHVVTLVFPAPGARCDRYKHEVEDQLGWIKAERAILTELFLRGPQTAGELRSRAGRMNPYARMDAVTELLEQLSRKTPPLVAALPREPGRSAIRYTHLLYPDDEQPQGASRPEAVSSHTDVADENLIRQVQELHRQVTDLTTRLEYLERQLL